MTVRSEDGQIILEGRCRVEEAETLLAALQLQPDSVVQLGMAETIHSAVIQILLAVKPRIEGISKHGFLSDYGVLKGEQQSAGSIADRDPPA